MFHSLSKSSVASVKRNGEAEGRERFALHNQGRTPYVVTGVGSIAKGWVLSGALPVVTYVGVVWL
jgi:hypothetical protein